MFPRGGAIHGSGKKWIDGNSGDANNFARTPIPAKYSPLRIAT